jgi:Xaa-Pro dipeptidase
MTFSGAPVAQTIASAIPPASDQEPFFAAHEYESRIARVREQMEQDGFAALLIASPENIYYLTGLNHQGYFAVTLLVLPLDGPPLLVARAMESVTITAQVPQCVHVPFADYEDPATAAVRALRSVTSAGDAVGVEQTSMCFPLSVWEPLRASLGDLRLVDGSGRVERLRQVKSAAEVAFVRRAAQASSRAVEAGLAAVSDGVSQREVASAVYAEMMRAGSEYPGFAPLIRSRDELLHEHVTWRDRPITSGDAVFMELSASVGRYHAPLTRMAYVGEPPPGTDEAAAISTAGLEAVRDALRPGTTSGEVYAAWQSVIDEGLGHDSYRRHHCGYTVGIGFPPSWVGGAAVVGLRNGGEMEVKEGMTFHVLSWILDQKPADYVISDTVLVTAGGSEILTTTRRDPIVIA